jgi:hypothetical protein
LFFFNPSSTPAERNCKEGDLDLWFQVHRWNSRSMATTANYPASSALCCQDFGGFWECPCFPHLPYRCVRPSGKRASGTKFTGRTLDPGCYFGTTRLIHHFEERLDQVVQLAGMIAPVLFQAD